MSLAGNLAFPVVAVKGETFERIMSKDGVMEGHFMKTTGNGTHGSETRVGSPGATMYSILDEEPHTISMSALHSNPQLPWFDLCVKWALPR